MTDEQIKKNAEDWAKPLIGEEDGGYNENDVSLSLMKNAFIAGAHSRDIEVMNLEHLLKVERNSVKVLVEANNKLRNPWISVEERIPEEDPNDKGYSVEVIGIFPCGNVSDCFCSIEEDIWFTKGLTCDRPTHWMPIPELKKG